MMCCWIFDVAAIVFGVFCTPYLVDPSQPQRCGLVELVDLGPRIGHEHQAQAQKIIG